MNRNILGGAFDPMAATLTADGSRYGHPGEVLIVPRGRLITTFNAQITKWGFCALGFVIGFLVAVILI